LRHPTFNLLNSLPQQYKHGDRANLRWSNSSAIQTV
jgi:hypothetical protein